MLSLIFHSWLLLAVNKFIARSVTCNDAYECANDFLSLSFETCECYGYRSCKNSYIEGVTSLRCHGSASCFNASYIETSVVQYCDGYASCCGVLDAYSASSTCDGKYSCAASDVLNWGLCDGELSCAFSNIYLADIDIFLGYQGIRGLGTLAFYKSHIYSNANNFSLWMAGYYTGYNSTIHCESGDSCTVYCSGNACYNLRLECEAESNCRVYCNDTENNQCPVGYRFEDDTNYNYDLMDDIILNLDTLYGYDMSLLIQIDDKTSNEEIKTYIKNKMNNETDECSVIADDSSEIQHQNINATNGSVCCLSTEGCEGTSIVASNNVFCDGYESCYQSNITINTHKGSVYARSSLAAVHGQAINFKQTIATSTTDSESLSSKDKNLFCSGDSSCGGTIYNLQEINNPNAIITTGGSSLGAVCVKNVSVIYALGYDSFSSSKIFNTINENLTVYFMGYAAASATSVTCQGNNQTICSIYCYNNACDSTTSCVANGESECLVFKLSGQCFFVFLFFNFVCECDFFDQFCFVV